MLKDLFIPQPSMHLSTSSPGLINGHVFLKHELSGECDWLKGCVRYIFASFFKSLKDTICETRKNNFISLWKLLLFSRKSRGKSPERACKNVRVHPQMHLIWDSGFFLLFSESPPPSSLADLAKKWSKVSFSKIHNEKCSNTKSSLKQIHDAHFHWSYN